MKPAQIPTRAVKCSSSGGVRSYQGEAGAVLGSARMPTGSDNGAERFQLEAAQCTLVPVGVRGRGRLLKTGCAAYKLTEGHLWFCFCSY